MLHDAVSQSRGLKLFVREIIFEIFQPVWKTYLNVTDRQDRQTTCNLITAVSCSGGLRSSFISTSATFRGQPRSLVLAPIESACATSYYSIIVTLILSCTVSEIWQVFVLLTPPLLCPFLFSLILVFSTIAIEFPMNEVDYSHPHHAVYTANADVVKFAI